ncbi:MAG: hemolysin family protein [Mycobacteriales bacterium]
MSDLVLIVVAVTLVVLAGVFAMINAALTNISRARVVELQRQGARGARTLLAVVDDVPRHISLLLLLQLTCELLATTLVVLVCVDHFGVGWKAALIGAGVMILVAFVLVGVGPRTLGRQHAYRVGLRSAGLTRALGRILGPLARLLIVVGNAITPGRGYRDGPFASQVELRELVDLAEQRGLVEHGEREMIHSVFELGDTIAREVMVPRTEIVWIERDKTAQQAVALALRSGFSRIPTIGENVDDIVGIAYLKDLVKFRQDRSDAGRPVRVEQAMRPATFVPESKPIDELLREMQAQRTHIAIVIDEYGGTAGLVTIEDILEEIVGEITDEYDVERPPVEQLDDGTVRVTARLSIEDLAGIFDVELPTDDVETVAGLLAQALGRVPIPGASVCLGSLQLTAESAGGRRNQVDTVLVRRVTAAEKAQIEAPEQARVGDG